MSSDWEFVTYQDVLEDLNETGTEKMEEENAEESDKDQVEEPPKKTPSKKYVLLRTIFSKPNRQRFIKISILVNLVIGYYLTNLLIDYVASRLDYPYHEKTNKADKFVFPELNKFPNPLGLKNNLHFSKALPGEWFPVENIRVSQFLDANPSINREFFEFSRLRCRMRGPDSDPIVYCEEHLHGYRTRKFYLVDDDSYIERRHFIHRYYEDGKNYIAVFNDKMDKVSETVYAVKDGLLYVKDTRNNKSAFRVYQRALDS